MAETLHGDFVQSVPLILRAIHPGSFAFLFLDPKGWRIDIEAIAPLLRLPKAEVLYNFMFDFINRAASMSDLEIVSGLNSLIRVGGWRDELLSADGSEDRKRIIVNAFRHTLASVGGYKFVAETPILRPRIDRPLYFLVYATRHKAGIEVFRNAQMKTLIEQELRRDDIRQGQFSGAQIDMFRPNEMSPSEAATTRDTERVSATEALLELVSPSYSSLHRVIDGLTCGRGIAVRNSIAHADRICWA